MSKSSTQWESMLAIEQSLNRLMATIRALELLAEQEDHLSGDFDIACRLADDGRGEIGYVRKHLDVLGRVAGENGTAASSEQKRKAQLRVVK